MLPEPAVLRSSAVVTPLLASSFLYRVSDMRSELKLIRKLHRLSRVSWSPTLRANAEALKRRETELQRTTAGKRRISKS